MTRCFLPWVIASSALMWGGTPEAAAAIGPSRPLFTDVLAHDATRFWEEFASVSCSETVKQLKLEPDGKKLAEKDSVYDYLIVMQVAGDELMMDESRILRGKPGKAADRALLLTSGFSTLLLVFHPIFQPSFSFNTLPDDVSGPRPLRRVEFVQKEGARSPSVLQLRGRDYPLAWKGTAWIDQQTGMIVKIHVDLKAPMEDIGLQRLSSDVTYAPVALKGLDHAMRLPQKAVIDAATKKQRWHNEHSFSAYRRFAVETDEKIGDPKAK